MNLLANENFPMLAVDALRDAGHDVLWAPTDMPGAADDAILRRASRKPACSIPLLNALTGEDTCSLSKNSEFASDRFAASKRKNWTKVIDHFKAKTGAQ